MSATSLQTMCVCLLRSALVLLVWFVAPPRVWADLPLVHLTWSHPAASMCPSSEMVEADIERLEGRRVFVPAGDADVQVRGLVQDRPTGATVQLEARSAEGTLLGRRELAAPAGECASLRQAVALVLTMLLEDEASVHTDSSTRRASSALQLGGGLALMSGSLPRVRPGVVLTLGVKLGPRWLLRTDAAYYLPVGIETERGVGATLQAYGLGLTLCPRVSGARRGLHVWLCAGTQLGGITSSPRKLEGPARQTRLLAQLMLELRLSLPVGTASALELSAGPLLSLARPELWYARADGSRKDVTRPALLGAIVRLTFIIDGR